MVRLDWDHTALPLPGLGFYALRITPEPGHPFGRKGLALAAAWEQLAGPAAAGLVILDGDVAVDPQDIAAMLAAIHLDPGAVHVAPVRLWPASTKRDRWVWGHGRGDFSRDDPDDPDVFGFCFTYLPRRLVDACVKSGLAGWRYPHVDRLTSRRARALRIPVRVVRGATPKHVNY